MFALWYLSLAIDEMRKYFGWTFLDRFYQKSPSINVAKKAIDNKSSTTVPSKNPPAVAVTTATTKSPSVTTTTSAETKTPSGSSTSQNSKAKSNEFNANLPKNQTIDKPMVNIKEKPVPPVKMPEIPKTSLTSTPTPTPTTTTKPASTSVTVTLKQRNGNESLDERNQSDTKPLKLDNQPIMPNKVKTPKKTSVATGTTITDEKEKQSTDYKNAMDDKMNMKSKNRKILASLDEDFNDSLIMDYGNKSGNMTNDLNRKGKDFRNATTNFLNSEINSIKKLEKPFSKQDTMVDAAVLTKLEEGFAKLAASDSKSLLKKYLTKEVFDNLKNKKTPTFGSTLLDCIQSGLENHDSGVGIYAPDAEAYTVFAEIFDPIIEDYHGGFKKTDKHPPKDFGDVASFANLDPNNEFVISTRVRCGRSLQGYPFNPCLTEAQYKEMEEKVSSTLSSLEGELKGKFYPLTGMEKAVQQQLIDDHFLFKEGDRFLQAANACRFWPTGRGIYHNDNKTFLVWCNEEDHLRIISMQMGGDLGEVYRRLVTAVNEIEKRVPFSHDDRLGFLTFCPTNLGTTIRASVHIKVPKLAANKAKLEEVAAKYNLQVRGTRGEHTEAEGGVYDISNKRRMGLTEYQAVKEMNDGITELIKLEKSM